MDNRQWEIILRLIFRYLSVFDLESVTQVCRLWSEIVKNIKKKLKNPIIVTRTRRRPIERKSWYSTKKQIIKNLEDKPILQIIFTNDMLDNGFSDACHCDTLPLSCYSLQIESEYLGKFFRKDNNFSSLVLPEASKLNLDTYTFIYKNEHDGLFCQEIRFNCGRCLELVKFLKDKIEPHFKNDDTVQRCMILLSRTNDLRHLLDIVGIMYDWFPFSKIPIWGGLTDVLNVCLYCFDKKFCRINSEILLIFISSPHMKAWQLTLDGMYRSMNSIKDRLIIFKNEIELKSHSIAFMHISRRRIENFYKFETSIFNIIFPNVLLFPIYGMTSLGGNNWSELNDTLPRNMSLLGSNSSLMILTYD